MASRRQKNARTELTGEQLDAVLMALTLMVNEERARPNASIPEDERGRGALDRVAQRLGVAQQSIIAYLNGVRNPGYAIANALHQAGRLDLIKFGSNPAQSIIEVSERPAPVVLSREKVDLIRAYLREIEEMLSPPED